MTKVLLAASFDFLAVGGFVIDPNMATATVAFVTTVGTVLAVIRWLDRRIEEKIAAYARITSLETSNTKHEITNSIVTLRADFERLLREKK